MLSLGMRINTLTNSADFIRKLSGTEGTGVHRDTLVKQVDNVAVPASLHR